jgi:hypothetical protein
LDFFMKKLFLYIICLFFGLSVYGQSWQTSYQKGADLLSKQAYKEAVKELETALHLAEKHYKHTHQHYFNTLRLLGDAYMGAGRYEQGGTCYRRLVSIRKEQRLNNTKEYAELLDLLAKSYAINKDYANAETFYKEGLALHRKLGNDRSPDAFDALHQLALTYKNGNRPDRASPQFDACLTIAKQVMADKKQAAAAKKLLGNNFEIYYEIVLEAAEVEMKVKNFEKAEALLEQYLAFCNTQNQNPEGCLLALDLAAQTARERTRYDRTADFYIRYLDLLKARKTEKHSDYMAALDKQINVLGEIYQFEKRRLLLHRRTALMAALRGDKSAEYALSLTAVGNAHRQEGQLDSAMFFFQKSIDLQTTIAQKPDEWAALGNAMELMATIQKEKRLLPQAEKQLQTTLELRKQRLGEKHPDYCRNLDSLGYIAIEQLEWGRADSLFNKAQAIRRVTPGKRHADYAWSLTNLGLLAQWQERYDQAEPHLRQAAAIMMGYYGAGSKEYAAALVRHAEALQKQIKNAESLKVYLQALEISKKTWGETHAETQKILERIAGLKEAEEKR